MTRSGAELQTRGAERRRSTGWRIACGAMTLAALGLVLAALAGAPLVSILLAGLLLLCPLLLWAPFRYQGYAFGEVHPGRREDD